MEVPLCPITCERGQSKRHLQSQQEGISDPRSTYWSLPCWLFSYRPVWHEIKKNNQVINTFVFNMLSSFNTPSIFLVFLLKRISWSAEIPEINYETSWIERMDYTEWAQPVFFRNGRSTDRLVQLHLYSLLQLYANYVPFTPASHYNWANLNLCRLSMGENGNRKPGQETSKTGCCLGGPKGYKKDT